MGGWGRGGEGAVRFRRHSKGPAPANGSADVEGLGAGRLTASVERDLLDPDFGLAEQLLAAPLERFAALVDRHRFLERNIAPLELLHDGFELGERLLERQLRHVGVVGHRLIPKFARSSADSPYAQLLEAAAGRRTILTPASAQ